jgi:hypothetical protein
VQLLANVKVKSMHASPAIGEANEVLKYVLHVCS